MEENSSELGEFDLKREDLLVRGHCGTNKQKALQTLVNMNHFAVLLKAESDTACWGRAQDFAFLIQI